MPVNLSADRVNIRIPYIAATMLSALELYCTLKLEIPP